MPSWPAKDPDTVADYLYPIPLDESDSVSTYTLTRLSGSVVIDSDSRDGSAVTAWLSGGTDGETAVFRIAWSTVGGRTFDDIITLPVVANEPASGAYAKPSPSELAARYPQFAATPAGTIAYWLKDAERIVTASWDEADYAPALMALAAHSMVENGAGGTGGAVSGLREMGVTDFKSASMSVSFDGATGNASGYASTRYGQAFAVYLRRNRGGPALVGPVTLPGACGC